MKRRCVSAGPRHPYRIRKRANVYEVVRLNMDDPMSRVLSECIELATVISRHDTEQDAERAIAAAMNHQTAPEGTSSTSGSAPIFATSGNGSS